MTATDISAIPARPKRRVPAFLPYLLISPSIVLLLALIAFPLLFALKNSFYFWNLQMSPVPMGYIGGGNYEMAFSNSFFLGALWNTLLLTLVGTAIEFCLGLAIALLLVKKLPGLNLARALLIMPTTIAPIVVGFLFRYMYDPNGGLIPWMLSSAGIPLPPQGLLGSGSTALWAILFADIWQWTPFFAIVLYAGLLSVPPDIIEAARLDKTSPWAMLVRIKLPLIRKTALIVVMLRFMQLFNTFDLVLVLTKGGPGSSTRTLGYSLYQQGLVDFNIGLSSAMTWMMVVIVNAIIGLFVFFAFKDLD
ncbi:MULTISPECIES: carbohydrate ABC transporter permease [Labrys]|uniref:carbohydrate ABC transporter permease n=1 Tax=Labrys TaxID=204476 RepID=UPI0008349969|nr:MULTISPECIES: sugar ABC transporter permease [unclassified Labrys (in: a-proteobacteria)]MDZ5450781.1 sugar ABC transporter permease [Labrys sp. ZIDIC5]OCC02267.1 sugar ABC transporter permease [Labrys sp. WJW]